MREFWYTIGYHLLRNLSIVRSRVSGKQQVGGRVENFFGVQTRKVAKHGLAYTLRGYREPPPPAARGKLQARSISR